MAFTGFPFAGPFLYITVGIIVTTTYYYGVLPDLTILKMI
jgi:hypothetical protein